jgi:hypothetical protein
MLSGRFRAALDIRSRRPEVAILVLSHYVQRRYADSLLASSEEHGGGLGYLLLDLMARGHSNAAIAEQLVVTERAVVSHTSHIYEVLGISPAPGVHRPVLAVLADLARDRTPEVGGSHPLASPASARSR